MNLSILPSAVVDIIRERYFYDSLEAGLGMRFMELHLRRNRQA